MTLKVTGIFHNGRQICYDPDMRKKLCTLLVLIVITAGAVYIFSSIQDSDFPIVTPDNSETYELIGYYSYENKYLSTDINSSMVTCSYFNILTAGHHFNEKIESLGKSAKISNADHVVVGVNKNDLNSFDEDMTLQRALPNFPVLLKVKLRNSGTDSSMCSHQVQIISVSEIDPLERCSLEFRISKPASMPIKALTNWKTYTISGYNIKVPAPWLIGTETYYDTYNKPNIKVSLNGYTVTIAKLDATKDGIVGTGVAVCDQGDYYAMNVAGENVYRAKVPQIMEMGHTQDFRLCTISIEEKGCDPAVRLGDSYFFITYAVAENIQIDQNIIAIMDAMITSLEPLPKNEKVLQDPK